MSSTHPARSRHDRPHRPVHGRRRAILGLASAVVAAYATFGVAGHLLGDQSGSLNPVGTSLRGPLGNRGAVHLSRAASRAIAWPPRGQAAFVLADGRPVASPHQHPVPIASVAKVMTAYLVLERYPLRGAQDGFTVTITAAQARQEAHDAAADQSVVAVQAGEQLTERQLLEALLIPSGNNIARLLAVRVAGSDTRFVASMNAAGRALGMDHTTYTDPSGWDPGTVSTAADQLRVLRQALRAPAFRQIVSMAGVTLPVAGTLTNTNPLVAEGYLGKTGSDSAAGGCLAFAIPLTVGGRRLTAAGVVLGQGQGGDTSELLSAAGDSAERLVASFGRRPTARVSRPHQPQESR